VRRGCGGRPPTPWPRLGCATSRLLFAVVDLLYGPRRSLVKFAMLELIARVPLPGRGNVTYVMLTHLHRRGALARRVFDRLVRSRSQQDNEQWHLLTLNDLVTRAEAKRSVLRHQMIPQLITMACYQSERPRPESVRPRGDKGVLDLPPWRILLFGV